MKTESRTSKGQKRGRKNLGNSLNAKACKRSSAKKPPNGGSQNKVYGIKKQYLKNNICKVTFCLPKDAAGNAEKVNLIGDFNNWDKDAVKMTKLKNGSHTANINLKCGREYQFRYLIDNCRWENDWNADWYTKNPFGCDNSVISV